MPESDATMKRHEAVAPQIVPSGFGVRELKKN
jgi:hypothetical protein